MKFETAFGQPLLNSGLDCVIETKMQAKLFIFTLLWSLTLGCFSSPSVSEPRTGKKAVCIFAPLKTKVDVSFLLQRIRF